MSIDTTWSGKTWGVTMCTPRGAPMLLGGGWEPTSVSAKRPAGVINHPLLFVSRAKARDWCTAREKEYLSNPVCSEWRFKPVRVLREITVIK